MSRVLAPLALALLVAASGPALAQSSTFTVDVTERTDLVNAPAIHSGAHAEHDGLWLVASGRTNGLHAFGGDAFPRSFENGDLVVYDRETDTIWSASTDGLDAEIREALRVTNGQFLARGDSLILVGGYVYRESTSSMATLGTMTVLDVPGVIQAIQTGGDLAPHITQPVAWDDALAVAGGHLAEVDGSLALIGGNRFDGDYRINPSPSQQVYTQAIRTLDIGASGFAGASEITDPELHRRDGNVAPAVLASGEVGLGIYGGVFTPDTQGAFLKPILYDGAGIEVAAAFEQHVGHYTSPMLPLYSADDAAMHTVFFGGINAFSWNDDLQEWEAATSLPFGIPFVDDIGVVSHEGGAWSERRIPVRMPGLLGTNAMFFLDPALPLHADGIIDLDALPVGTTRAGWIVGGITSTLPNGGTTSASDRVLEVSVSVKLTPSTSGETPLGFSVAAPVPNPARGAARVAVTVETPQAIRAEVFDVTGRSLAVLHDGPLSANKHTLTWGAETANSGTYIVRVTNARGQSVSQPVVLIR